MYSGVGGGMPDANDPYGIGSYFDNFGDWGDDTVDFGEEGFNFGDFDVDSYLDSILNFEEDYTDDPYGIGAGYDDAFDWGDDDNAAFNEFIIEF